MSDAMIKVKFFNMHLHRSTRYDLKSYEEDKGWMIGLNGLCTPDNSFQWKDIQLTFEDDYDYAVVLDTIFRPVPYINPAKSILFRLEPKILRDSYNGGIDYLDESKYIKVYKMNCLWGWLGMSHNELWNGIFEKTKILSSIIASSYGTPDHAKRLQLLSYLDHIPYHDHFGIDKNKNGFFDNLKCHCGELLNKKNGLCSYKYHYNAENSREKDYFTEKIIDSILAECLTFYSGCPNMSDFIDSRAFIPINIDDPEQCVFTIKRSIRLGEWEKRIDIIRQEKKKVLEELNILNLVFNAMHGYKNYWEK
jgi:hypothetical protein